MDELAERIFVKIADRLGELTAAPEKSALITSDELARELSCSTVHVRKMSREGMPHVLLGGESKRYSLDEVLRWLRSREPDFERDESVEGSARRVDAAAHAIAAEAQRKDREFAARQARGPG